MAVAIVHTRLFFFDPFPKPIRNSPPTTENCLRIPIRIYIIGLQVDLKPVLVLPSTTSYEVVLRRTTSYYSVLGRTMSYDVVLGRTTKGPDFEPESRDDVRGYIQLYLHIFMVNENE